MMQQQIIIKVPTSGGKTRTKVLTIAAKTKGVTSVAIKGQAGELVVVTGTGVDSAELTRSLRKKVGDATNIVSVQSLNERPEVEADRCCDQYYSTYSTSNSSYNRDRYYYSQPQPPIYYYSQTTSQPHEYPPNPVYYKVVDDPYPSYNNNCTIM
ncbi:hypothetical protein ACOSQ2_030315 [Xanthoceras sorbifolium]